MKLLNRIVFMLTIFLVVLTAKTEVNIEDDVTIEDEDNNTVNEKEEQIKSYAVKSKNTDEKYITRKGNILWPYPVNATKVEKSNDTNNKEINGKRDKRLLWSYPYHPIIDMMKQNVAYSNNLPNSHDPFDFLQDSYPLPKGFSQPLDVYDYIIVGAGTAGSVLASRLTEDQPRATVLVIEAGKPEMLLTDIPALVPYWQLTDYTWPYRMEHQSGVCMGSEHGRCYMPRGKAVGGTSVTNFMLYTRGRPQDWDRIASVGNYGWSYSDVLKYYMKSEKSELKTSKKYHYSPQYHGHDGELSVSNVPFRTNLIEAFLEAGRLHGNPTVDYNAPDQLGFGYIQTTTSNGHRLSTAKAFLHPHKRRKNLHIISEATVGKILIDNDTKRAYGAEYIKHGTKYTVRCRREIILSAGPIASPQLLMLSGIGPRNHLTSLGISVIKDLQVGRTLYDHIGFPGVVFRLNTNNASLFESKIATLPNLIQWMQYGDGLMTTPGSIEGLGYIKTSLSDDPELVPDIELISLGSSITLDSGGIFRKSWKISDESYYTAFGALDGVDTWSAVPMLLHPKSKGYLELRDKNIFSYPKIFGNYYTHPKDLATMKEAIKYVIKLGESEPFKKFGARLHLGQYPSCRIHPLGSEDYWDCALKTMVISLHHQIATCKMGPAQDPDAVVDPELRVYGIEGLRVVDSSIIPTPVSAHTCAPAVMIGEKAADMIKKYWANII